MSEPTQYGDELGAVIVTYHSGDTLDACLDSLHGAVTKGAATKEAPAKGSAAAGATVAAPRVVLSDNSPSDPSAAEAARRARAHHLANPDNPGYGVGINRGVAELGPDVGWVVIANADLEFAPGALDELLAAAKRWPRGGAFGPLISDPDGTIYPSARLLPSLGRGIGHALLGTIWPANPWTRAYQQSDSAITERESGWLSGSCQLLRREAFDSVGGFDQRYFMYFEDVDLGDRLGRAGWQNVYVPSACVTHVGGVSTSKAPGRMLAEHHRSAYRYLADRHPGWKRAPVRFAVKLGLAVRSRLARRSHQGV